jgi:hypothetical protein
MDRQLTSATQCDQHVAQITLDAFQIIDPGDIPDNARGVVRYAGAE